MLKHLQRLFGLGSTQRRPSPPTPRRRTTSPTPKAQGRQAGTPARAGGGTVPAPVVRPEDTIQRPSRSGQLTGYEPKVLLSYHAPVSLNAHGIAGLGLFEAGFSKQSVYSGQLGEVGLYKAMCMTDLIDRVTSFWSVAMPGNDGRAVADTKFTTDVDCVMVQGNTMYLIDLKYYASGDVTWHSPDQNWLMCRDTETGKQVGKPRKMSRNMAMAHDRFTKIFPRHVITSYVVLIPTNAGIGRIAPGTAWPGDVPLITLPDFLTRIRQGQPGHADPATAAALSALVQG